MGGGGTAPDPETSTVGLTNTAVGGTDPVALATMAREYVWGPGDRAWGGGVDELLVQFDASRSPWWMLSDGGGDVVAMCKKYGSGSTTYAKVAAQWTYDAYGAVLADSVFDTSAPVNHCGHKGLFADRLDVGVVTTLWGPDTQRFSQGAELMYANRNRSFSPRLGRFLQNDPNETGSICSDGYGFGGASPGVSSATLGLAGHFANGANTYTYLGSSPWHRSDPSGLLFDITDVVMIGFSALRGGTEAMIGEYGSRMESDVDWTADWDQNDDGHSRLDNSWVWESFKSGAIQGMLDELDVFDVFDTSAIEERFGGEEHAVAGWFTRPARVAKGIASAIASGIRGLAKTWRSHGSHLAPELIEKAKNSTRGVPQGWFLNQTKTGELLKSVTVTGKEMTIAAPKGFAKVALPSGRVVEATRIRILGKGHATKAMFFVDHAYPMP